MKITDSEGRFIIISPRQSDLVSLRMAGISDWLRYGDGDFVPDDTDTTESDDANCQTPGA